MATITVKPYEKHYSYGGSNYWKYYQRIYDGDESTYESSMSGNVAYFRLDLSAIPAGNIITNVQYIVKYYRSGTQDKPGAYLAYTDKTGNNDIVSFSHYSFNDSSYQTVETLTGTVAVTSENSQAILSAKYPLIRLGGFNGRLYEVTVILTYEAPPSTFNNIRVGSTKVNKVYIGSTPVKEIYIGSTKIL